MHDHGEDNLTSEQKNEIATVVQRTRGHFLSFWLFCTKAKCRRARTCAFDPDFCMAQVGPSVPQDVRDGVNAMINAQCQGQSFDEMLAHAQDRLVAYCKWLEKVEELKEKAKAGKRLKAQKPPDLSAS